MTLNTPASANLFKQEKLQFDMFKQQIPERLYMKSTMSHRNQAALSIRSNLKSEKCERLERNNLPTSYNDPSSPRQSQVPLGKFLGLDRRGSTALSHYRNTMANKFQNDYPKYEHDSHPIQHNKLWKNKISLKGIRDLTHQTKLQRINKNMIAKQFESEGYYPRDRGTCFGESGDRFFSQHNVQAQEVQVSESSVRARKRLKNAIKLVRNSIVDYKQVQQEDEAKSPLT